MWLRDNLEWLLPLLITSILAPSASYIIGRTKATKQQILERLDINDKKTDLTMQVSASILRRELKESASILLSSNKASLRDKELWEADYELYENIITTLGIKNGLIEHLREDILALPIEKEDTDGE